MAEIIDIRELNERIERQSSFVDALMLGMNKVIVGQKHLIESLLIGLLSDGHILLEGVPGLAKTLAIKTLADLIKADFSRIQFTPDLLPADVLGTQIYSQKNEEFTIKQGPMKLTVHRPKYKALCWKPCRNAKSQSAKRLSNWRNRSLYWPHKTR